MPFAHVERPSRASDEVAAASARRPVAQLGDYGGHQRLEVVEHGCFPTAKFTERDREAGPRVRTIVAVAVAIDLALRQKTIERSLALFAGRPGLPLDLSPSDGASTVHGEPD